MRNLVIIFLLTVSTCYAGVSTDITVTKLSTGYQLSWDDPSTPVTLVRGDFDEGLLLFTKTEIYTGMGNSYTDTLGNFNTKFYRLEINGGQVKHDLNQDDFYTLVNDNLTLINHDQDSLIAEARFAQFGSVGIVQYKSPNEGYKVVLNYSGTTRTFYNVSDQDGHINKNYYIIDNLSLLSSITFYKLYEDLSTDYRFKLNFDFGELQDDTQIVNIIGGTQRNISITNGDVNTYNGAVKNEQNSIFAGGTSGGGSGGGCLLK